jgi:ComF family protein
VVPFAFADPAREAVHRLKYHGQTWLAPALAAFMAQAWEGRGWGRPDLLVPVPLHWTKVVTRGFNQAQLLATCLGRVLDVPVANLLRRRRRTSQQARLSREQRLRNVREAFVLRRGARPAGLSIVVVDDVMTTGATLQGVTEALLEQGSGAVSILCLARAWSDSW